MTDTDEKRHVVTIDVSGVRHTASVEARKLLVHLLRDDFGLTGTHVGCDTSQCGACTVDIDGQTVKSCTVLAVMADGASITTIEGLAQNPDPTEREIRHHLTGNICRCTGYTNIVRAVQSLASETHRHD